MATSSYINLSGARNRLVMGSMQEVKMRHSPWSGGPLRIMGLALGLSGSLLLFTAYPSYAEQIGSSNSWGGVTQYAYLDFVRGSCGGWDTVKPQMIELEWTRSDQTWEVRNAVGQLSGTAMLNCNGGMENNFDERTPFATPRWTRDDGRRSFPYSVSFQDSMPYVHPYQIGHVAAMVTADIYHNGALDKSGLCTAAYINNSPCPPR